MPEIKPCFFILLFAALLLGVCSKGARRRAHRPYHRPGDQSHHRGMEQRAAEVLEQHRSQLNALAEALLARETLNRKEIDQVLDRFGTAN